MSQTSDAVPAPDSSTGFAVEVGDPADGVVTVTVSGALDLLTAPPLGEALEKAAQSGGSITLDLRHVEFLGSAGLSVLVEAAGRADETGGKLAILATNHAVVRAVQVTGLDAVLHLFSDPSEASAYLHG